MVRSCGADASVVASWMGWIKTSLLRCNSLLNWSSQLELWALMVLGGQKWSERLGACDPRVHGALLFRCMIAGLCWHFSNFPWLCKVFLQTFLHFASQFRNLKAILKLGGDFTAISKLRDHFAAKWHFCRPFHSCEMGVRVLWSGTHVPNGGFAALKHPAKWGFGCEIGSFYASQPFHSCKTPCELGFWLRNWAFSCFGASQPFRSYEIRVTVLQNGPRVPKVVSQLRNPLPNGVSAAKFSLSFAR